MWCLQRYFKLVLKRCFKGIANVFDCGVCKGVSDWYLQKYSHFKTHLKLKSEKCLKLKSEKHLKTKSENQPKKHLKLKFEKHLKTKFKTQI